MRTAYPCLNSDSHPQAGNGNGPSSENYSKLPLRKSDRASRHAAKDGPRFCPTEKEKADQQNRQGNEPEESRRATNSSALGKIEAGYKYTNYEAHAQIPELKLFCELIVLAINDLHNLDPFLREEAGWWIFQDRSEGFNPIAGYISFEATCGVLGIDPHWARGAIKKSINGQEIFERMIKCAVHTNLAYVGLEVIDTL